MDDQTKHKHEQIEARQKELQVWTAKIKIKKTVTSERDVLTKKAIGLEDVVTQAEGQLAESRR
jgi:hypothetical protein